VVDAFSVLIGSAIPRPRPAGSTGTTRCGAARS